MIYQQHIGSTSSQPLKDLLATAIKKGYINTDIGKQVEQVKRRIKERDYLTPVEVEQLFKAVDHEVIKTLVKTLYYAGLRIGEGLKLTLKDIDLEKNVLIITKGKMKQKRIIPINYKLRKELQTYIQNQESTDLNNRIFISKSGTLTEGHVNRILREATIKAGLGKRVTTHIFRHSFASTSSVKVQTSIKSKNSWVTPVSVQQKFTYIPT